MTVIECRLFEYPRVFRSGYEIMSAQVVLGQDSKNTTARVVIVDPGGLIASELVAHSIARGGILPLEDPAAKGNNASGGTLGAVTPKDVESWQKAVIAQCAKSGVSDPAQIAYILATAKHESGDYKYLREIWGPTAAQSSYEGRDDLGNDKPGDGKRYMGRGLVQITGRKNYTEWSKRLGINALDYPEKMELPEYALVVLVEGMRDGTFTGEKLSGYIGGGKKDFTGARYIVNGTDQAGLIAGYAEAFLADGTIQRLQASSGTTVQTAPPSGTGATDTPTGSPEVKGAKLSIVWDGIEYETYHQGTVHSLTGATTTIEGVGIRWVLNRRPRNRTLEAVSLKDLATGYAQAHGVKLDYKVATDVQYDRVDQRGISDYAFLKQQCDRAGLFIGEEKGTLTIKSLDEIRDTRIVLTYGVDVIDGELADRALDPKKTDNSTAASPSEAKSAIDPIEGTLSQDTVDVDPVPDASTTGVDTKDAGAKVAEKDAPKASAESGSKARLKGLPTWLSTPTSETMLLMQPMDALRTEGFAPTFNRVWVVDKVSHSFPEGISKVDLYSPVEVPVTMVEPSANGATGAQATQGSTESNPQGFINPLPGSVMTSPYGPRGARMHNGIDLATVSPDGVKGGTVVSAASGTVAFVRFDPGGYGNYLEVSHANGWSTLYGHLYSIAVQPGQKVLQGQVLGIEGTTGGSSGVHLHWEVRNGSDQRIDPATQIKVQAG